MLFLSLVSERREYTISYNFFWATRFYFYFLLIFSFLGRALDYAGHPVSFWAHVNLPYRIVSCRTSLVDHVVKSTRWRYSCKRGYCSPCQHITQSTFCPLVETSSSSSAERLAWPSYLEMTLTVPTQPLGGCRWHSIVTPRRPSLVSKVSKVLNSV